MKTLLKVIVWALLSLMIQAGVLLYLDNQLFKETDTVEIHEVEQPTKKSKDVDISLPDAAENIKASYDGKYIMYTEGQIVKVADTTSSSIKNINPSGEDTEILYGTWAPQSDVIIMAESRYNSKTKANGIYLTAYNIKSDTRNDFTTSANEVFSLCNCGADTKVLDIAASYQTGVTYVSVLNDSKKNVIYRIDTNGNFQKLSNSGFIDQMKVYQHLDVLLYRDSISEKIYKYTNGDIKQINTSQFADGIEILKLTNDNDMIIGVYDKDKKITDILRGKIDTSMDTWSKYKLDKPKESKDIFVTENCDILVNDSLLGKLKNIETKDTVSYDGKVICFSENYVISEDSGKIYLKSLSDIDEEEATVTAQE